MVDDSNVSVPEAPVTDSPAPPSKKQDTSKIATPKPIKYKLNLYQPNGLLRSNINPMMFATIMKANGDIIRSAHQDKFCTIEEIHDRYISLKKQLKYDTNRTVTEIRSIMEQLVEAGLVESRVKG